MAANVESDCCSICLGEYKDPRILPCQHVFCLQCLCDYVAKKKQINCPNCMTEIEIPAGGVAALLKYGEDPLKETTEPEVCTVCEKGVQASFQCFECDKCMCDACKKCHDVFSSKHQVRKLQASDSEMACCENHPKVVLQFYCKTCKCLICQQCMDDGHNSSLGKHIVLGIEDYLTEIKKTFKNYQAKIDAKLQRNSNVIDSFISKETAKLQGVKECIPKLEANFKVCKEIADHRKKIYSEEDEILSKKLTAAIKHLDKPSNKSENIRELIDLTLNLESKIKTHQLYVLNTNIGDIDGEMGTLNVTMGRLCNFHFDGDSVLNKVFFVGDIHWNMSVTAQHKTYKIPTKFTLSSFVKEEDKQLVESVRADLIVTLKVDDENYMVKKQSKTFSASPTNKILPHTIKDLTCSFLYSNEGIHYNWLEILFDIKEIKYKNNLKKRKLDST